MVPADVVVFKAGDGQRTNAARQARFRARQRLERWNAKQADHDARVTEARTRAAKYAAPDALETLAACIAEVACVSMQCLARDKHFSLSGPYARVMAIQARLDREFNAAVDHLPVVRLLAYVRQVAHDGQANETEKTWLQRGADAQQAKQAAAANPSPKHLAALRQARSDTRVYARLARLARETAHRPVRLDDLAPLAEAHSGTTPADPAADRPSGSGL